MKPVADEELKTTVVVNADEACEYFCTECLQLRLFARPGKPTECGNCGCEDLVVGRIGELDKKELTLEHGPF